MECNSVCCAPRRLPSKDSGKGGGWSTPTSGETWQILPLPDGDQGQHQ